MSKAAKLATLEELHMLVAKKLKVRLGSDDASPQDFAQAIKFLKDNGVEPARDSNNKALTALSEKIANMSDDDEAEFLQ